MKTFRLLPLFVAVGTGLALPVSAQNLVDLYDAALTYDAAFQSAKSQYDATLAKADQAKAAILPTAGLSMGANVTNLDNTTPGLSSRTFNNQTATLSASQPLYRPANRLSFEQGMKQIDSAHAQLMKIPALE